MDGHDATPIAADERPGAAAIPAAAPPRLPDYLVRHYWWAYLWPPTVWFFDHAPIVDAIVFGQYRRLQDTALRLLAPATAGDTLLIASAYGSLVPELAARLPPGRLSVVDVAPIQLARAARKLVRSGRRGQVRLACMNAEQLDFPRERFDRALMFLLLHELPPPARARALRESLRVLRPGGRLVIVEYGARTATHPFHRYRWLRWIFGTAEPFLPSLWDEDLDASLAQAAAGLGRRIECERSEVLFGGFYRGLCYRVEPA